MYNESSYITYYVSMYIMRKGKTFNKKKTFPKFHIV